QPKARQSRCWAPGSAAASALRGRHRFGGALRIAVEAPCVAVQRDAAPGASLLRRRHLGPVLHLLETASATLALRVALAGGADRDAGCVGRRVVPVAPCGVGGRRKALLIRFVMA